MYVNDVLNAKPGKLRLSLIYDCEKVNFLIICKILKNDRILCGGGGGEDCQTRTLHLTMILNPFCISS